jgi:cytochrome P450
MLTPRKGAAPLPGPAGLPGLGSLRPYLQDQPRFLISSYRRYGPAIRFDFLGLHGAILCGAAANRYILVDAAENFLVAPIIDRARARWIVGRGLLFIDEPEHKRERRLILPAMHRTRLEGYQQVMRATAARVLDRWRPGQEIDIAAEMDDIALIVEGRTLFNVDFSAEARELGEAVTVVVETMNDVFRIAFAQLPFDVPGLGYGGSLRRAIARVDTLVGAIIARHEQDGADAGDVVSMMLAARDADGSRLSARQVRDHLLTLFVAGHETVANALAWACYLLAQHPPITARLLTELTTVLAGRAPTLADLERLPYLEQVVKEVLRLYPPATSLFRTARDAFTWEGYRLPAGATIMYTPFVSHRIAAHFPDPEVFRPERFDPALNTPPPAYAYIPFGGGPRSCVGAPFALLELQTVLAMIVQRWRLDLVPQQQVVATVRTTLQPQYGVRMRPYPQDAHPERSPAAVYGNVVGARPGPA